jgi:hypothetical protein
MVERCEKFIYNFSFKTQRDHLEDLSVDGSIIFKSNES